MYTWLLGQWFSPAQYLVFTQSMLALQAFLVFSLMWKLAPPKTTPLLSCRKVCFNKASEILIFFHANYSQHPLEASVVSFINALQVVERDGMTQQLFVEGKSEATINVETMEHSHTQHTTNKVEIGQMLLEIVKCMCVSKRERERERERV